MKRNLLIKHLKKHGCSLRREGSKYSIYENKKNNKLSTVPRHPDVNDYLAEAICKQLGIPKVK